jgi:antitoxin MazE
MQVSRWGASLAVKLPAAVVEALELKEGDQIEVRIVGERTFEIERVLSRQKAVDRLKSLSRALPAGFRFDRDEGDER